MIKDKELKIVISTDFSDAVGARDRVDGKYSGQEFYEDLLKNKLQNAIKNKQKVSIDFDNTWGYPASFLSGVFGRAARDFEGENVLKYIDIKSDTDRSLLDQIKYAIKNGYDED